jgi:hypothetical protein
MRRVCLVPLLLLGCLQTAFWPAAEREFPGSRFRIADLPLEPVPAPVEPTAAFQKLAEAVQQLLLPAAGKLFKAFPAPASVPGLEITSGAARFDVADRATVRRPLARLRNPRAPPAAPSV